MKLIIRGATPSDFRAWIDLRFKLWPDCPLERHQLEVAQVSASPGVAVASIDCELVGFAEVSIRADHVEGTSIAPVPYLEGWYVSDVHRGQGIGRALLAFVEEWSARNGYRELASDAALDDEKSIRLQAMLGFQEVGRTVHFVKSLAPPADQR
jgi:aminoglycoside 6'-N-acetyltransferase I